MNYQGLENKEFIIYQRKKGCPYYDQYEAYTNSDVIIFNSLKYQLESLMNRKPATEVEIIDECDDFLDSFANTEQINLNRFLFSLNNIYFENEQSKKVIDNLIDIANAIKSSKKFNPSEEISEIKGTLIQELLEIISDNKNIWDFIETDETSY